MKSGSLKGGFTLIEMLLVVAIIAVLVAMVVGLTKRIDDQGKERLCRDTIELIGNALEQFRDFGYEYKDGFSGLGLDFPLDCNNFTAANLESTLSITLYPSAPVVNITQVEPVHDQDYSGCEAMYFILSQVPDCRQTLDKIDKSLLTNEGTNGTAINIQTPATTLPFKRIIDPWGKTLHYDYYDDYNVTFSPVSVPDITTRKTFPVVTSAGPDGIFDTSDDIINRQPK